LVGAKFIEQGADLIIQLENSSEDIVLNNFKVATASDLPIQLTLADGTVVSLEDLQAPIDAAAISNVAPAAGGSANGAFGGGAAFATAIDDGIGNGLSIEGLLEGTELEFADESECEEFVVLAEETIIGDQYADLMYGGNGAYMDTSVDMAKSNANISIFNDEITGTSSTHTIVGDQLSEFIGGNQASSELDSEFDITGSEEGDSGSDNTVVIHGDSLVGGENSEIIVGDNMSS